MPRLIIANLDCEGDHAREMTSGSGQLPRLPLPVRRMIASAGALLCGFARPGDVVWTPEPVDTGRIQLAQGRQARFTSGALALLSTIPGASESTEFNEILAWGETLEVNSLRTTVHSPGLPGLVAPHQASKASLADLTGSNDDSLADLLWRCHPEPVIARRANDRRYSQALAAKLGVALPGSTVLASLAELERHLARGGLATGHHQAWVLKAALSAAARQRVRRRGAELDPATRTRVSRLFAFFGELVFEPWVDRVLDFGATGVIVTGDRFVLFPPHRLHNDPAGVFRGIALGPGAWPAPTEAASDLAGLNIADLIATASAMARQVAGELAGDGYRGPFGIDGFVYRDQDGTLHIHPLCEINARLSFGFLARVLAEPYAGATVELQLGSGPVPRLPDHEVIPLLEPAHDEQTAAWLVIRRPPGQHGGDQRGLP